MAIRGAALGEEVAGVDFFEKKLRRGDMAVAYETIPSLSTEPPDLSVENSHSTGGFAMLYGAWDSRSTQTKLQRIIMASVQAAMQLLETANSTALQPPETDHARNAIDADSALFQHTRGKGSED